MSVSLTGIFAVISVIVHLSGYVTYSHLMKNGHSRPNMATWTLWVFLSALNCASYLVMSGDPAKAAVSFTGAFACTVTFIYSLKKGRVSRLNAWDSTALTVGVLAAAVWWGLQSATYANLILQFGFFISMIPTYRGVIKDHSHEKPLPWFVWGTAYAINLAVVIARWNGHAADLAYPLFSMITHTGVGITTIVMTRRAALVTMPALTKK